MDQNDNYKLNALRIAGLALTSDQEREIRRLISEKKLMEVEQIIRDALRKARDEGDGQRKSP